MTTDAIPNRPVFRAQEVCEIADLQPYVLRSWEAEFPDLGHAKSEAAPRVYRRADVERVLRIKHLLLVDGLTLAGARRQLIDEGFGTVEEAAESNGMDADVAAMVDEATRSQLRDVKHGLQWILGVLSGTQGATTMALPASAPARIRAATRAKPRAAAKPARRASGRAGGRKAARRRR